MHNFIPPERFFPYLTWQEIDNMPNREKAIIVQPVGAIEQHGLHLPLIVDAAISMGVLGKALARLPAEIPLYALPCLYYGKSNEHCHFPGTITLNADTLINELMELGVSLYRSGFRKLVLMNSHGGQPQIMEIVARDLHEKFKDFLIFPLFTWNVPHDTAQLLSEQEIAQGIHAGDAETSLMLSLLPDQVKMARAVCEYPPSLPTDRLLSLEGKIPFAWLTHEISQSGVIGDATTATQEKGDRILDSLANGWKQALEDIYYFEQPNANRET